MLLQTNWYKLFYWMTRADGVRSFFDAFSNLFMTLFTVSTIVLIVMYVIPVGKGSWEEPEKLRWMKQIRKVWIPITLLLILTWAGYVFCPTKKETLLIMAGGGAMKFLTTDSASRQLPHEMTTYVVNELHSMAEEAKVDIGISEAKDKLLEEVKGMSGTELIEKMKADSNLVKVILAK